MALGWRIEAEERQGQTSFGQAKNTGRRAGIEGTERFIKNTAKNDRKFLCPARLGLLPLLPVCNLLQIY